MSISEVKVDNFFTDEFLNVQTDYTSKIFDRLLVEISGGLKGKKVLNIGCYVPDDELLFCNDAKEWYATDFSQTVIDKARNYFVTHSPNKNVLFEVGDARDLKYSDEYFDVILSFSTIDHIPEGRDLTFKEMRRLLKKDGFAVLTVPNFNSPYSEGKRDHNRFGYEHCFTKEEIELVCSEYDLETIYFIKDIIHDEARMGFIIVRRDNPIKNKFQTKLNSSKSKGKIATEYESLSKKFINNKKAQKIRDNLQNVFTNMTSNLCIDKDTPLVIYGSGSHTDLLFEKINLNEYTIIGIIDKNPTLTGTKKYGIEIFYPQSLNTLSYDAIIISSYEYQEQIYGDIKSMLSTPKKIIKFYEIQ